MSTKSVRRGQPCSSHVDKKAHKEVLIKENEVSEACEVETQTKSRNATPANPTQENDKVDEELSKRRLISKGLANVYDSQQSKDF